MKMMEKDYSATAKLKQLIHNDNGSNTSHNTLHGNKAGLFTTLKLLWDYKSRK